jgi:hypothetical protein
MRRQPQLAETAADRAQSHFSPIIWVTLYHLRTALGLANEWSESNESRFVEILK